MVYVREVSVGEGLHIMSGLVFGARSEQMMRLHQLLLSVAIRGLVLAPFSFSG